ncbi:hypothetical protein [Mucilaginibacter sp.]|uniref:hypothetical protein n=1 Tax=Mucilaginibacter sp. TaxID=1882438 RepID=UPI00261A519D|nr:hypothetical protein [Mucilaginibacter sp.]MDB4919469.1 hypothetical protein [Mucilaginibacter sp.]
MSESLPWTVKTIYRDFKDENLPYEKLLEYSRALKYDFKAEFPELEALRSNIREPYPSYKPEESVEDDGEYYRRKYEEVLEKYNNMLEKYNELLQSRLSIQGQ